MISFVNCAAKRSLITLHELSTQTGRVFAECKRIDVQFSEEDHISILYSLSLSASLLMERVAFKSEFVCLYI